MLNRTIFYNSLGQTVRFITVYGVTGGADGFDCTATPRRSRGPGGLLC